MAKYNIVIDDVVERDEGGNYAEIVKIIEASHDRDFKCEIIHAKRNDATVHCEWERDAENDEEIIKHVEETLDFDNIHIERNGKIIWSNYPE